MPLQTEAKTDAIPYDRGGFSDSTEIINPLSLHLEGGVFDYEISDGTNRYSLANTLFRLGLIEDVLEFRLANSGFNMRNNDGHTNFGAADLTLGAKVRFNREYKFFPALGVIPLFTIPFGDRDFSSRNFEQSYTFLIDKYFTDDFYTLINLGPQFESGSNKDTDGNGLNISLPYVFSINYDVTRKLTLIGEIVGSWGFTSGVKDELGLAAGFTYAPTQRFIFDITTFYGLNRDTPTFQLFFGFGYKLF